MQTRSTRATWWMILGASLFAPITAQASVALTAGPAPATLADLLLTGVGDLQALAEIAGVEDAELAASATRRLRAAGPAGLTAFVARHRAVIAGARAADLSPETAARAAPILAALDQICGQRDCAPAQLYWYTDLEQAKAAARASGRPIVSLRLLGDLREELSCANSRFFRALLYPDPAVSAALRDGFVLHWHSERAAPKITIDLGDGRRVETTITGNSAHLVLDSAGRPVDVLPGLTTPQQFLADLQRAGVLARSVADKDNTTRAQALRRHHETRREALETSWNATLAAVGQPPRPLPRPSSASSPSMPSAPSLPGQAIPVVARAAANAPAPARRAPRAGQAAMLAPSKSSVEVPMLLLLGEAVEPLSESALWEQLVDRRAAEVVLSPASLALVARQQWRSGDTTEDAAEQALALAGLRRSLALDGLYNEFALHAEVHRWFAEGDAAGLDAANLSLGVYRDLFLTPHTDPWLGLAAPSVYTGLVAGGRSQEARI